MIRWLLCPGCHRAWTSHRLEVCDLCGEEPIDCQPRSGDIIAWMAWRRIDLDGAAEVILAGREAHRGILAVAIARRGRWSIGLDDDRVTALALCLPPAVPPCR